MKVRRVVGALPSVLLMVAPVLCGSCGGGPAAPTPVSTPPPLASLATGTALSFVSGETNAAVAGAAVVINGQSASGPFTASYTTAANGQVVLDRQVMLSPAPLMDVTASGYLGRNTLLRSETERTFTLWPTSGRVSQGLAASLVYTPSRCPAEEAPNEPLRRIGSGTGRASIVLEASLRDDAARSVHEEAASRIAALPGGVTYTVTEQSPGAGVSFTIRLDPGASVCGGAASTVASTTLSVSAQGEIVGGTVTYCSLGTARSLGTVLHELGHTAGFRHSPNQSDVMFCTTARTTDAFSEREAVLMSLMFQRRPGNRWPDDDRDTTAALRRPAQETFVCFRAGGSTVASRLRAPLAAAATRTRHVAPMTRAVVDGPRARSLDSLPMPGQSSAADERGIHAIAIPRCMCRCRGGPPRRPD